MYCRCRSRVSVRSWPGCAATTSSVSSTMRPVLSRITRREPATPRRVASCDSAQSRILHALDAFLPLAVDIAEADHMGGDFTGRVIAAVFTLREHAGRLH